MSDFEDFIDTVIKKGDIGEARRQWQPQYKDQRLYEGLTAVHLACIYTSGDRGDMVRLLVSLGCDFETNDDNGLRPLHWCAYYGRLDTMQVLLEAGCSLSPLSKYGQTPLMLADMMEYHECASILRSAIEAVRIQRPSMENYVESDLLGIGTFGSVYKCNDPNIGKFFSIKKVPLSVTGDESDEITALDNKIKIYSKWNYHNRIMQYFGTTINEREMVIFMEYVQNGSLKDELNKSGPFPINLVAKYSRQILEGLDFLHGHKVIHGDIKATNILRDSEDDIKLTDFGISIYVKTISHGNNGFTDAGTPHWMAPEVIKTEVIKKYEYKVDVWSLGATILEMLTGKPPFHDFDAFPAMYKIGGGAPVNPYFPSNLGQKTKSLLKKMFVHNPSKRADVKTLLQSSFFQDL